MDTQGLIDYLANAEKKTPVKVVLRAKKALDFPNVTCFPAGEGTYFLYGDWKVIAPLLEDYRDAILDQVVEADRRNSSVPLLDTKSLNARIEPGAFIREQVEIGDNAVVMMGAVINIGAVIGAGTMIDMGAVLGGRATVGQRCHIGAGAVLAGVIEPASATPVIVEDDVLIGANAVIIEGVRVGKGAVVAAGAIVIEDVPPNTVVAGCPARVIKEKDQKASEKTALIDALRKL